MAGIGIELQQLLKRDTYFNMLKAFSVASVLSAGPWIISIIAILLVEFLKVSEVALAYQASKFQISVIYLIAASLIFSSFSQQSFSRFIADYVYYKKDQFVLPNFHGMLFVMTFLSGVFGFVISHLLFSAQSVEYQCLMASIFVLLCNIWFATCLLTGLKKYRIVLLSFLLGYGIAMMIGYFLRYKGTDGLLTAFFIGQFLLLLGMTIALLFQYPSDRFIAFNFLKKDQLFLSLVFASIFYNLAVWIDKFIFWYSPVTGHAAFSVLHVARIYDVPMFIAYVTMIPGMAIFLLYVETDFSYYYEKYYQAIAKGGTLSDILDMRFHLIAAAKRGLWSLLRLQCFIIFMIAVLGQKILSIFHLSPFYQYTLNIDVVSTSLLVLFIALMNFFSYLDKRRIILYLTGLFCLLNLVFTIVTQYLGPYFYGYGFAASLLVVVAFALLFLNYHFNHLEAETFLR